MAQRRGSSVPVSGMANPFWSQRIRAEWDLQAVRPADLPVPEDEETQKQLEQGKLKDSLWKMVELEEDQGRQLEEVVLGGWQLSLRLRAGNPEKELAHQAN